jgi:uncharacterized membrane protein
MTALFLAFGLGVVAGLRTFTAPAAVLAVRGYLAGFVLIAAAVVEYVMDLLPKTPSRTLPIAVSGRLVSGAFSGYMVSGMHGSPGLWGAIAGIAGSLVGTYGGHAARLSMIARIGAIPAALTEDIVAIALAVLVVTR